MDLSSYARSFTLKNGVAITLRAIRVDDRERLHTAIGRLEPGTLYTRFFGAKKELSEAELTAATDVDFDEVFALVAVLSSDPEIIIGGGRYVRLPGADAAKAEIAFMVEEDYQGLGLASLILRELSAAAKSAGVIHFIAEILPGNAAMLNVFRRSGHPMSSRVDAGVVHVRLTL
jgi:RimJ/RimL family protein N-acetyltransferase